MRRRQFLATTGIAAVTTLAGCSGESGSSESDGGGGSNESSDENTTESGSNNASDSEEANSSNGSSSEAEEALHDEEQESTVEGLEILDHELADDDFGASVTGVVENGTGRELEYVEVGVVVYNEEGQRTEDWFDNTTNLPDGEQWVFEVLLESSAHEVSDYTIAVTDSPF